MPDFSMCESNNQANNNNICPIKNTCRRYISVPSYRQSYSQFQYNFNGSGCDMYMPVNDKIDEDNHDH